MIFKIGDYAYHMDKGFGKIIETNNIDGNLVTYKVHFDCEDIIIPSNSEDYAFLTDKFILYLIKKNYENQFSFASYQRGENYFDKKKIISFDVQNNLFKGVVEGSRNYNVYISYSTRGNVNFECTCPYEFKCKHEVAFLLFLTDFLMKSLVSRKQENEVKNVNVGKVDDNASSLIKRIKQATSMIQNKDYIEELASISQQLSSLNDESYAYLLVELYKMKNLKDIKDFMLLVLFHLDDNSQAIKLLNYEVGVYYTTVLREAKSNKNSRFHFNFYSDERTEIIKKIVENDPNSILEFICESNGRDALSGALIEYVIDKVDVNEQNTKGLVELVRFMPSYYVRAIKPYISKCDFKNLRAFQSYNSENLITIRELDLIKDESIFNAIGKIASAYEAVNYVIDNVQRLFKINKALTISVIKELLFEVDTFRKTQEIKLRLVEKQELIPYSTFIRNRFGLKNINFYLDDKIMNSTILSNQEKEKIQEVMDCFEYHYEFYSNEKSYSCIYQLNFDYFGEKTNVLEIIEKNDHLQLTTDSLGDFCDYRYYVYFYEQVNIRFRKQIEEDIERFEERNKAILEKVNDDKVSLSIENFKDKVRVIDAPLLLPDEKVKLEYYFITEYGDNYLYLKVGNNKMFTVQNLDKFATLFQNSSYERYGKSFGFYHTYANLEKKHEKVLKYLIHNGHIDHYYKKYYCLSNDIVDELFDLLTGETIYYCVEEHKYEASTKKEIPYLVTLNNLDYKIDIDEKYQLNLRIQNEPLKNLNFNRLKGLTSSYIFINHEIKRIGNDVLSREIFNFGIENNGYKVKNNLETFINEIYLRKPEVFQVNENIKAKFEEERVAIHLYFDYNDKVINVKRKFVKGEGSNLEQEIKLDSLTERDKARLSKINSYLEYLGFEDLNEIESELKNEDMILNFFRLDFNYLKMEATIYLSDSITNKKIVDFPKTQYQIRYEHDLMTIFMEESSFSKEELADIYNKIKRKKKFIVLKNNTIVNLDNKAAKEFEQIIADFNMNYKNLEEHVQIPVYQALKAYAYEDSINVDSYIGDMISKIASYKTYDLPLLDLNATLRSYQTEGVQWLTILSDYHLGGILADDMGLGKTLQMIATIKNSNVNKPSLVVCPKTLIFNWKNEFAKFDPSTTVTGIYGLAVEREKIIRNIRNDDRSVYITSYDSLRNDIDLYTMDFNYVVLDEAQVIKNVQALKSQSVKKLHGDIKFALTGTPIENNILDLWSIFDFILPSYFTDISDFKDNYEHDEEYLKFIVKKVTPFILRRTKKDVLKDLPDKYQSIETVELKEEQLKIYHAYIHQAKELMNSKNTFEVLQFLTRLRQICVDPGMFVENYNGGSAKIDYLKEHLSEFIEQGHKVLIFSQFVSALRRIEDVLKELNIDYFMLTGETKAEDRVDLCNQFNKEDASQKVFLVSLKAGGNGINLTGADIVIHLDPWWNVSAENQATDRAHRIGQTKNVKVMKLIAENTIEQRVIELQNMKKDLIDKVIANDDSLITKLTQEDLKFILS